MPKTSFNLIRKTLIFAIFTSFVFVGGYALGVKGFIISSKKFPKVEISRSLPPDKSTLEFSLFWKVWDTLSAKYYDKEKLVPAKMVYGAISGMVSSLGDPYTIFLEPSDNKVVEEDLSGSFEGIGIQVGYKDKQLAVIAPLPGSPAEKAGLKAGDYILHIEDNEKGISSDTSNMTIPEAVSIIRGPKNTEVILTILREGSKEPSEIKVKRESIDVPSVVTEFVGDSGKIAHIHVVKFSAETVTEWDSEITEVLKKPEVNSIILDLRNNPGGYLEAAVQLASDFVDKGSVAVIQEDANKERQEFKTDKLPRLKDYKTVVLVNKGSASASEILSGALRDDLKIKIIGDTSFGKGTIQEPETIDNGAGLHITIAKWLTPKGTWVHEVGLKPDIEVSNKDETPEDEQLQTAIKELQK